MLFGKEEKAPSLPPCFSAEIHTDQNFHPKRQERREKLELDSDAVGWVPSASPKHARSPLPVDFVPLQHLSCIVGGIPRF